MMHLAEVKPGQVPEGMDLSQLMQGPASVRDGTTHMILHDGLLFLVTTMMYLHQDLSFPEAFREATKLAAEFASLNTTRIQQVADDAIAEEAVQLAAEDGGKHRRTDDDPDARILSTVSDPED